MNFIREAKIEIKIRRDDFKGYTDTLTIEGLRVSFYIQKSLSSTPNYALVRIWNLSQDHRNLIKDFGDQVTVYAGYERGTRLQVLFVGDTTAVSSAFELPEIVTTLECSDGYKYVAQKFASLSFAPGTKVRTVIDQIAEAYQIDLVEFAISDDLVYGEGFEQAGSLSRALDKATKLANLQWSIQNNQLQIIPINGAIVEEPYIVNADTGMIGIPQRYTSIRSDLYEVGPAVGWKVTTFLNPQILPGARINLSSVYLGMQGIFRVETIRHNGDIFGPQWISNLEVTQLNT